VGDGKKEEQIFLGREIAQHRDYSEDTARKIDEAVKWIVLDARDKVITLLGENLHILKAIAAQLLEKETIMLEDIDRIIDEHRQAQGIAAATAPATPGEAGQQQ